MSKARYLHGYSSPEQQRLLDQAAHWRQRLILHGSRFEDDERLLEIGCGVGAVLGVLGQAFPKARLHGVDWEASQLALARRHLRTLGVQARLQRADAMALPLPAAAFDQVWMMWFLEHVQDPLLALREARRVLRKGGGITSIEIDYHSLRLQPWTPALQGLLNAFDQGMDLGGRSDAGSRLEAWLLDAGFSRVEVRALAFEPKGTALHREIEYLLGFIEGAIPSLLGLPGAPDEARLRQGARDFRAVARARRGRLRFCVHKAWARKA